MSNIIDENYSPEIRRKSKLTLLWLGIFSIIMLFGGLTSGYIVSKGDFFWVKFKLPSAFITSTVSIILSSLAVLGGQYFVKKGNTKAFSGLVALALVLGLLFGYSQYKGFKEMFGKGYAISGGPVLSMGGKYGEHFSLTYQGKELNSDGSRMIYKGEEISVELKEKLHSFSENLLQVLSGKSADFSDLNYGNEWLIYANGQVLTLTNGVFNIGENRLTVGQREKLKQFARDRAEDRGDFTMKGIYGEDYWILYQGQKLDYENRTFYLNGKTLSAPVLNKLDGAHNNASSYVYAFTGLHLLHWVGGIIALLVMLVKGLNNKYSATEHLGVVVGARYWHFLGLLWLYLYLFLIIIH